MLLERIRYRLRRIKQWALRKLRKIFGIKSPNDPTHNKKYCSCCHQNIGFIKEVDISGTTYRVYMKTEKEHTRFVDNGSVGEIDQANRAIYLNLTEFEERTDSEALRFKYERETLRHEILHAYLNESGLLSYSWHNEDMIN